MAGLQAALNSHIPILDHWPPARGIAPCKKPLELNSTRELQVCKNSLHAKWNEFVELAGEPIGLCTLTVMDWDLISQDDLVSAQDLG